MARTRVCVVGGGSYTWTPTLLGDLAAMPDLDGVVVLHVRNQDALAEMGRLGRAIVAAAGSGLAIETTSERDRALAGANFVVLTITTGGLAAMRHDLEIPLRYGIVQTVGDTVGPGGLARALRNIPVVVDLAQAMERLCPDAWLLNLSNPLTTLTRAVTKHTRIKTVGLCHEPAGVRRTLARLFARSVDDVAIVPAGINHLSWLVDFRVGGKDGRRLLREHLAAGGLIPMAAPATGYPAAFADRWRVKLALFELYGLVPAAGDRHLAEFFPFFLGESARGGAEYDLLPTTIGDREEIGRRARDRVRGWLEGAEPLPAGGSGEEVAEIIAAVANGRSHRCPVNLPNRGQIENLPPEIVVETPGVVGPDGAVGLPVGPLPLGVLGTVQPHVVNQELIVEAALTDDRRLALQALVNDPMVRDLRAAPRLLDELLAAHADLLPRFAA